MVVVQIAESKEITGAEEDLQLLKIFVKKYYL
jgi:hypothetical protein